MPEPVLTIGALAKKTDTKVETIRYYERIHLLAAPGRTSGNYRIYGAEHLGRLSFIRRARDLGFSIEQVRELLSLADQRTRSCARADAIARQHLAEVEGKIADLNAMRRELRTIIDSCGRNVIADCRIIDALSPMPGKSKPASLSKVES
jgi:Cu(I)-responsive transcriptional regulator